MDDIARRKTPDELLREADADDSSKRTGKLKIFFGYAAGVGKTYAMLDEARDLKEHGVDVVIGYVEPHQRPETSALAEGFERIPLSTVRHNGIDLHEFDLDAALRRHPQVVLVDELAHTNAPACRHRKRYRDVEELLRAGIDVYTTMNVQHLESLNDKVALLTDVSVRERVPDRVFDGAASVELVDIEPADLIARLSAGKVYGPDRIQTALDHFFSRKNLSALREIALRRTADRLDRNPDASGVSSSAGFSGAGEDVLVYVTAGKGCASVIRAAANLAQAFHGNMVAFEVESVRTGQDAQEEVLLRKNVEFAEELGARVVTVSGDDPARQIALYAPAAGISKVVVGVERSRRMPLAGNPFVNRLMSLMTDIQVVAIPDKSLSKMMGKGFGVLLLRFHPKDLGMAVVAVAVATTVNLLLEAIGFSTSIVLMLYLLVIMIFATKATGLWYALIAALGGMLAFNFFFTPPLYTFNAYGSVYPLIFGFLFAAAFISSSLTIRANGQADQAARRAYRTEILLESSRRLQKCATVAGCFEAMADQVIKLLDRSVVVYVAPDGRSIGSPTLFEAPGMRDRSTDCATSESERAVAAWAVANKEEAGAGTDTLMRARCLYLPVSGKDRVRGAVGIVIDGSDDGLEPFEKNLLLALLDDAGMAIDQIELDRERQAAKLQGKTEALRSNLLRSVSHDFRTPLTSISGDAEVLMADSGNLSEDEKQGIYQDIHADSIWLIDLVGNLLTTTRMDDKELNMRLQPELVDDVIAESLSHADRKSSEHRVSLSIGDGVLLAMMDAQLIMQVLVNLVNNAVKYTPVGSDIEISASRQGDFIRIAVADDGPGIPAYEKPHVFEMFYNGTAGRSGDARRSMGLGLALCKSIVEGHGGRIGVEDRHPHGCEFWFTLPAVSDQQEGGSNA
jgi:two-component system sensor histidine kinase KdpD